MDILETFDRKPTSLSHKPPRNSLLEFQSCESAHSVVARGEGLTVRTLFGLILGSIFWIPAIVFACYCLVTLLAGAHAVQPCLFGLGFAAMLTFFGYFAAKPSLQTAWCNVKLEVSNGFLSIEHSGPFGDKKLILRLANVIETSVYPTFVSSSTNALWVRMPTYDFQPLNRFLQNKDCRRHSLLSYGVTVISGRRAPVLNSLKEWIDAHVDREKMNLENP